MTIEGGLRGMVRRQLLSDFERGILDDVRILNDRVEDLETQEYLQPGVVGAGGGLVKIEESIPSSDVSSITFSSLGTHTHLMAIATVANDNSTSVSLRVQFNADTGTNYDWESAILRVDVGGHNWTTAEQLSQTSMRVSQTGGTTIIDAASATIWFPNYRNTNFYQHVYSQNMNRTTIMETAIFGGRWVDTSAVTSIKFMFGNPLPKIRANSVISLYGIA